MGVSNRIRRIFADPRYFPIRGGLHTSRGGEKAPDGPIRRDSRRGIYHTLQKSERLRTPLPVADFATCNLSDYWLAQSATRPSTPMPLGVVVNARPPRNGARAPTER